MMLTILSVQVSGSGPRCSLQLAQYEDIYDNHGGCSARPGVVAGKGGIECRTKCFTPYCTIADDLCRLVLAHTGLYLEYLLVQLDREALSTSGWGTYWLKINVCIGSKQRLLNCWGPRLCTGPLKLRLRCAALAAGSSKWCSLRVHRGVTNKISIAPRCGVCVHWI